MEYRIENKPAKFFRRMGLRGIEKALEVCFEEKYQAQFAPEVTHFKVQNQNVDVWDDDIQTPSIKATGKTKRGNKVVVYAHVSNYFSNPKNITKSVDKAIQKYFTGAGPIPKKEFQRLLNLDGMSENGNIRVRVIDYNNLRNASYGEISIQEALEHPQTIPFLGSEENATSYLKTHKKLYFPFGIGIAYTDDFNEDGPRGRLLSFGSTLTFGLRGDYPLDCAGRFLGSSLESQKLEKKN